MNIISGQWLCIVVLILIVSCTRDAKITPPKAERQITLSCFISPDEDTVSAVVAWSKPIFRNSGNQWEVIPVANASVIITGDKGSLALTNFLPNESAPKYWAAQPAGFFEPGKMYTITIAEPGGKSISAATIIPMRKELNIRPLLIDSSTVKSPWGVEKIFRVRFSVTFDDDPAPGDRYRITAGYFSVFNRFIDDSDTNIVIRDSTYVPFYLDRSELHSDVRGNGSPITVNIGQQQIVYKSEEDGGTGLTNAFYFTVLQTDESYFRFHQYAENYFGDDPFSEPNPMFSNVTGGQGIFGSYIKHVAVLRIR
jgi:hypothetical protein